MHLCIVEHYHAGLPPEQRASLHARFVNDEIDVLTATTAFGMGIDKPDIRQISEFPALIVSSLWDSSHD